MLLAFFLALILNHLLNHRPEMLYRLLDLRELIRLPDAHLAFQVQRDGWCIRLDALPLLDDLGPVRMCFAFRRDHATLANVRA